MCGLGDNARPPCKAWKWEEKEEGSVAAPVSPLGWGCGTHTWSQDTGRGRHGGNVKFRTRGEVWQENRDETEVRFT